MKEEHVDNTLSYTNASGWKVFAFLCIFLVAGFVAIIKFDSYFTDFWKIRNCNPEGYARGDFMSACGGIKVDRYSFGSIYLGAQKNAVKNAEDADVIVFGNSRTMRSFSTDAIDKYFKDKGLSYMVLASEGASFRSAILTSERMKIKPKIILVNSEVFISDKVSPAFRDLVDFPEKYETRYSFFNAAQTMHKFICTSKGDFLKSTFCEGRTRANWRSADTGRLDWTLVADPEKQVVFDYTLNANYTQASIYTDRALELFQMKNYKNSCPVLYQVNSPRATPKTMEEMARSMGIQSAFAYMRGLASYDGSHLDRPTSEIWATEFVKALDPVIDNCLAGKGRLNIAEPEKFDIATADIRGVSDFETWRTRFGLSVNDAAGNSPDGKSTADIIMTSDKPNGRLYKSFTDRPISIGEKMRFSGWFWTENEDETVKLRLQIVRGCSAETQVESSVKVFNLSTEPQRLSVEHLFENDQKCGLVLLSISNPNVTMNAWQGRVEYNGATPSD